MRPWQVGWERGLGKGASLIPVVDRGIQAVSGCSLVRGRVR